MHNNKWLCHLRPQGLLKHHKALCTVSQFLGPAYVVKFGSTWLDVRGTQSQLNKLLAPTPGSNRRLLAYNLFDKR